MCAVCFGGYFLVRHFGKKSEDAFGQVEGRVAKSPESQSRKEQPTYTPTHSVKQTPKAPEEPLPYFPPPLGSVLIYESIYPAIEVPGQPTEPSRIVRTRCRFASPGTIDVIDIKKGVMLSGRPQWSQEDINEKSTLLGDRYRVSSGVVEVGKKWDDDASAILWMPLLKVNVSVGDKWTWKHPFLRAPLNDERTFTIKQLGQYKDRQSVVVQDRSVQNFGVGAITYVTTREYARGVGLVRQTVESSFGTVTTTLVGEHNQPPSQSSAPKEQPKKDESHEDTKDKVPELPRNAKLLKSQITTPEKLRTPGVDCNAFLKDVKVYKTESQIIIDCEADAGKWSPVQTCYPLLVRLFDSDGNHLTHFTTKERFTTSERVYRMWSEVASRFDGRNLRPEDKEKLGYFLPVLLKQKGNRLVYSVNRRDLRDAELVEVGFRE